MIFACLTSVQLVPFPWDLSTIKTQPHSLFHPFIFNSYYNQVNSIWRSVDKFYKDCRLSDLAKSKANFKWIPSELKQVTLKIRKKGQVVLRRQRTKNWLECYMGWLGCQVSGQPFPGTLVCHFPWIGQFLWPTILFIECGITNYWLYSFIWSLEK